MRCYLKRGTKEPSKGGPCGAGRGGWDISSLLGPDFLEPKLLRGTAPRQASPTPKHDPKALLDLFKLRDSLGLLRVFPGPRDARELCRVFHSLRTMVGIAWLGIGEALCAGASLTRLHCPPDCVIVAASTDRSDFYHQFRVSPPVPPAKNALGFFVLRPAKPPPQREGRQLGRTPGLLHRLGPLVYWGCRFPVSGKPRAWSSLRKPMSNCYRRPRSSTSPLDLLPAPLQCPETIMTR